MSTYPKKADRNDEINTNVCKIRDGTDPIALVRRSVKDIFLGACTRGLFIS